MCKTWSGAENLYRNSYWKYLAWSDLKSLVTEVYKCLHGLNPELMWDIFQKKETTYSLRRGTVLVIPPTKSSIGQNSFQFRASLAWNYLPACVKNVTDLKEFKSVIRHVEIYCQCKLCAAHSGINRWFILVFYLYFYHLVFTCFNLIVGAN